MVEMRETGDDRENEDALSRDTNCMGLLKEEFRVKNFGLSHPTPHLFVSSQWASAPVYLGWRVFWAVYHVAWIVYDWTDDAINTERPGTWMIYLTNWNFLLLTVDTVLLALVQVYVTCTGREFKGWEITWYLKVTWVVYTVASVVSLLVTILYFALLFDDSLSLMSGVMHLGNSVYVILDLCVTAMPVRLYHVIYPDIYACLYVIFSVIYWAADGLNKDGEPYIYEPLDWHQAEKAVPLALGMLIAGFPFQHFIFWSLYMIKIFVWTKTGKGGVQKAAAEDSRNENDNL